jgi:hypothetical protein
MGLWYAGMDLRKATNAQYDWGTREAFDLQALHVFDGSRTAMAGICTGYVERNPTRRQKMSSIVVVAIMLPRFFC